MADVFFYPLLPASGLVFGRRYELGHSVQPPPPSYEL